MKHSKHHYAGGGMAHCAHGGDGFTHSPYSVEKSLHEHHGDGRHGHHTSHEPDGHGHHAGHIPAHGKSDKAT